jgi:MtN3 and saliva related transmembrane protein
VDTVTAVGLVAATLTTASNIPQLKKCWETRSAGDLSLRGFSALTAGVIVWTIYGVMRGDWVIVGANLISLFCLVGILTIKLREGRTKAH